MPENKTNEFVLQIKNLDPDFIRRIKVYEAEHDLNHAELFRLAFSVLIMQESLETEWPKPE